MIVVHVQHYLNKEGVDYFPKWLESVANTIQTFEGFVTISQLTDVENKEACHLLLMFDSLPQLRNWAKSQEHDDLIAKFAPYRLRKQTSEVYEKHADL